MKKFRKLLKENRWMFGGIACLIVATMIFSLSSGIGASAENLNLGNVQITEENGVYKISTKDSQR